MAVGPILAIALATMITGCSRSGDRLLVSNTTGVPILVGPSGVVEACSNAAFTFAGAWVPVGLEGNAPLPSVDVPGAVPVVIEYRPPIDGLGSSRTVAIVSVTGVEIRREAPDPDPPANCSGHPPMTP
jgi:hypothetical protein